MSFSLFSRSAGMPASSKTSSDAFIAAMPRIGTLLSCQPSAPGIGWKPGFISKRVDLSCPHQPPNLGRSKFLPMPCMDEDATDIAGARVQVLVGTPGCKIDVPVVQGKRNVAGCVSEIETRNGAHVMRCLRKRGHVEQLAVEVINTAEEHHREFVGVRLDCCEDVFLADDPFAVTRTNLNDRIVRIKTVELRPGSPAGSDPTETFALR